MREHPNAVVVRRFYEAFARKDRAELEQLLTQGCVLLVDGGEPTTGHRGRHATVEWFLRAGQARGASFNLTPLAITGIGALGVAVEHAYATAPDAVLSVDAVRVFHLADRRIDRIRAIDLDADAAGRFWGSVGRPASSLQVEPPTFGLVTAAATTIPGRDE